MANIVSNKLTVTGPDADRILKVTTARFSENAVECSYDLDPNGPITAYFSGVNLPESRRRQQTTVYPDEQKVVIEDDKVVIFFDSKWSTPVWEVQELSRQFPVLTFRLKGWDISGAHGWLFSFTAGRITELDLREDWTPEQKALAAKYKIRVTSDAMYSDPEDDVMTEGTILFEGVERRWTWENFDASTSTVVIWGSPTRKVGLVITEGDVLHKSTWRDGASRPEEVYEAVVNELQAGPPPTPRDGGDDDGDDPEPEPDEYIVVKAYAAAAGG